MEKSDDDRPVLSQFNLAEFLLVAGKLWEGRATIALITTVTTLLSIIYLHLAIYTYTTAITLIPTQSQSQDMQGQFGGLAAMVGINLQGNTNSVSPFTIYPEALETRQVASEMIKVWPEVMHILFKDQWDRQANAWHPPSDFKHTVINILKPLIGVPARNWRPPGPADLQQYIAQSVQVIQDKKKPLLTMKMQAVDPYFSRKFLLVLHLSTDRMLRLMTLDRAKKYSAYLEKKLTIEQTSAVRDVLTQSLSQQETLLMMGNSDTDFAAEPLGPPESSARPTAPAPIYVLLLGILSGVFVGGFCAVMEFKVLDACRHFFGAARAGPPQRASKFDV